MECLVVGLGNPGSGYAKTRHNLGFLCVEHFAKKNQISFRQEGQLSAKMGSGRVFDKKVYLLLPLTYMNSSGEAVKRAADYFRIPIHNILIVCDDINIPFGTWRLRPNGRAAGHNGLKSIEAHMGTSEYARLRVGVSDRVEGDLADYVLSPFTEKESEELPKILENVVADIEQWLKLIGE